MYPIYYETNIIQTKSISSYDRANANRDRQESITRINIKKPSNKKYNSKRIISTMKDTYTKTEVHNVKKQVLELLEKDIRCRNDDKYLTYCVMRKYTNIYIPFEDFGKIPAFETIKRTRANIQNKQKLFLPTIEEVRIKRRIREETFKEIFS